MQINYGWSLPPGVTHEMIDEQFDGDYCESCKTTAVECQKCSHDHCDCVGCPIRELEDDDF